MSKAVSCAVLFALLVCLVIALKPEEERITFTEAVNKYTDTLESVSGVVSDVYEDVEAFGGKLSDLLSPDPVAAMVKAVYDSVKGVPGATYFLSFDGGFFSDDLFVRKDYYQYDADGNIVYLEDGTPQVVARYTFWVKRFAGRYEVRYCPTDPNTYEQASFWDSDRIGLLTLAVNPFPDPVGITSAAHRQFSCGDPNCPLAFGSVEGRGKF